MAGPIFTKLFSTSPMSYLKKHVGLVVNIVALAQRFQAASQAGDWAECDRLFVEIEDTEREADKLKAEFQLHLPRGVFLPVYRSDLLEIMIILDRIPNEVKDYAGISLGRQSTVPAKAGDAFAAFIALGGECVALLEKTINELDDLFRSGFSDKEIRLISDIVEQISVLEHKADKDRIELNRILRSCEAETPPLDMMFIYQMLAFIAGVSDHCREVGYRIVGMNTR